MNAVIEGVRKTSEAERLAMAQAARGWEQELVEQMPHQTAAAKRRAEEEAENRYAEIASERQAVVTATSQSVDAETASAAVAAARIEGERAATARTEQERQELQEQLQTAGWKWPMPRL
eukprot:7832978-Pyramimonas_sp.AAC.1